MYSSSQQRRTNSLYAEAEVNDGSSSIGRWAVAVRTALRMLPERTQSSVQRKRAGAAGAAGAMKNMVVSKEGRGRKVSGAFPRHPYTIENRKRQILG